MVFSDPMYGVNGDDAHPTGGRPGIILWPIHGLTPDVYEWAFLLKKKVKCIRRREFGTLPTTVQRNT